MSKEAMKLALEAKIHNAGMNPIMQGECYLMHPEAMQKIIDEALREALAEQPAPSQYGSPELQAMIVARALEKDAAEQPAPVQQEPATKNVVIANMGKPFTVKAYVTPQPAQQEPVTEFKSPGQRWEDGDDHDSRSEALYKFIAYTDFKHCGDSFCFKSGGDGDNGETLMFILDCWFAQQHTSPQPAQQEQKPVALREALREAAAAALTSVYVCGRVWSAWHIGTMTEDDFSPASECDWLLDEIVHAVATAAPQPAQRTWVGLEKSDIPDESRAMMQLFTDPENQPTQHGTVTLEYMQREIVKEREACAKVCESEWSNVAERMYGEECATAIRARGNT